MSAQEGFASYNSKRCPFWPPATSLTLVLLCSPSPHLSPFFSIPGLLAPSQTCQAQSHVGPLHSQLSGKLFPQISMWLALFIHSTWLTLFISLLHCHQMRDSLPPTPSKIAPPSYHSRRSLLYFFISLINTETVSAFGSLFM